MHDAVTPNPIAHLLAFISMSKRFIGIGLILALLFVDVARASTTEFTFGSTVIADPTSSDDTNVATLDSTHVISVTPNGAAVGTISGDSISFGSVYALPETASYSSVTVLDSTHAVIAYSHSSSDHKVIVATISGTSVSYGSAVSVTASAYTNYKMLAVTTLDSTHVVIAYAVEGEDGNPAYSVVGSISGTTITLGSPVQFADDGNYVSMVTINSTHFLIAYGESTAQTLRVGSVSGTSITLGTGATNTFGCTDMAVTLLDATHAVMAMCDANASNLPKAVVATISDLSVSLGTPVLIGSATYQYFSLVPVDATRVAVAYRDFGNSSYATVMVLTVNGTSITPGTAVVAIAGNTQFTWMTSPVSGQIVLVGKNTSNGSKAEAVIGTIDIPVASSSSSSDSSSAPSQHSGGRRGNSTQMIVRMLEQRTAKTDAPHPSAPLPIPITPDMPQESMSGSLQIRTCDRVEKWFAGNEKMMSRVNERLLKRFGFVCEG